MKTANMIMCAAVMVGIPVGAQSATIPCTMTPSCSGVVSYERVGKFCATYKEAGGYYNNSGEKICFMECDTCFGATSISECYIPAGTTGRDASGTFTYTSNCYWKQ